MYLGDYIDFEKLFKDAIEIFKELDESDMDDVELKIKKALDIFEEDNCGLELDVQDCKDAEITENEVWFTLSEDLSTNTEDGFSVDYWGCSLKYNLSEEKFVDIEQL